MSKTMLTYCIMLSTIVLVAVNSQESGDNFDVSPSAASPLPSSTSTAGSPKQVTETATPNTTSATTSSPTPAATDPLLTFTRTSRYNPFLRPAIVNNYTVETKVTEDGCNSSDRKVLLNLIEVTRTTVIAQYLLCKGASRVHGVRVLWRQFGMTTDWKKSQRFEDRIGRYIIKDLDAGMAYEICVVEVDEWGNEAATDSEKCIEVITHTSVLTVLAVLFGIACALIVILIVAMVCQCKFYKDKAKAQSPQKDNIDNTLSSYHPSRVDQQSAMGSLWSSPSYLTYAKNQNNSFEDSLRKSLNYNQNVERSNSSNFYYANRNPSSLNSDSLPPVFQTSITTMPDHHSSFQLKRYPSQSISTEDDPTYENPIDDHDRESHSPLPPTRNSRDITVVPTRVSARSLQSNISNSRVNGQNPSFRSDNFAPAYRWDTPRSNHMWHINKSII